MLILNRNQQPNSKYIPHCTHNLVCHWLSEFLLQDKPPPNCSLTACILQRHPPTHAPLTFKPRPLGRGFKIRSQGRARLSTLPITKGRWTMKRLWSCWWRCYRRYFDFRGYSDREEFWSFCFIHWLIAFAVGIFSAVQMVLSLQDLFSDSLPVDDFATPWGQLGFVILAGLWALFCLLSLIPGLAVTVRRYRDAGFSGRWFLMLILVSLMLLIPSCTFVYDTAVAYNLDSPNFMPALFGIVGLQIVGMVHLIICALPSKFSGQ